MDLSLDENQELLKRSAREFVQRECPKEVLLELEADISGHSPRLWREMARMGWLGVIIPPEHGGVGGSLTDAGVLLQELGRGPVPGPLFSTAVLGALLVLEGARPDQSAEVLPAIARGEWSMALAAVGPEGRWGSEEVGGSAQRVSGGYVLSGVYPFVHDAMAATHFVCATQAAGDGGSTSVTLWLVNASTPGVSIRALPGFMAGVAEVTLDSARVTENALLGEREGAGWEVLQRAASKAIPVLGAYQVGGCEAVYEMSVAYSQTRIQFGMPVGRFQRVQDHVIDLVNQLDAARWTTYEALWKLDTGRAAEGSVHLAKAVSSEAYYQACNHAHEVHAGVGVMTEYGLTLHTRMSRILYHHLGGPLYHKRRLAETLEL